MLVNQSISFSPDNFLSTQFLPQTVGVKLEKQFFSVLKIRAKDVFIPVIADVEFFILQ